MTPAEARHWLHFSVFDTLNRLDAAPVIVERLPQHILRAYQFDILAEVARLMSLGVKRILVVLPTGGGKTVMASAMIQSARSQCMRNQFIVHRKELLEQTSRTFARSQIQHGFIAADLGFDYTAETILAGIQTLVRRVGLVLPPKLAIVDEAHHATANSWATVLETYADQDCFIVGLTATPERLDGRGLGEHFDAMVIGPTVSELIEWGYLSKFDYYAPGVPDLKGVRTTAGDFNRADLADFMDKPKLIGDLVTHYNRLAAGEQGIVFATSIEHSKHIATAFEQDGITAAHVDGELSKEIRHNRMSAFIRGDIRILSNVDLFGEGFDVPAVSYVGDAQPTKSLGRFLQKCGRALRIFDGKQKAIICDHSGNAFRHGLPDDEHEWSLQGKVKGSRKSDSNEADFSVRQCKVCFRVVPSVVKICPGCDTEFPIQQRKLKQEDGELTKLERAKAKEAARVQRKIEERECQSFEDYRRLAIARNYSKPAGWAKVQWKLRNGGRIS